jgi:hypothetical protein
LPVSPLFQLLSLQEETYVSLLNSGYSHFAVNPNESQYLKPGYSRLVSNLNHNIW